MGPNKKRKRSSATTQPVRKVQSSESSGNESTELKKKKQNGRDSGHSTTTKDSDSSSSPEAITCKEKKMQTPRSILKQMVPSSEELEYRKEKTKDKHDIEAYSKRFSCTKCNLNFQPLIEKQKKITAHPLMDVLMCEECCSYYGDGNFSLDSDNEDKYCRWCGEGGTLFTCSKCICGFCHRCIERHFGKDVVRKVKNEDDWCCYFCNPKPLWNLRLICSLAKNAVHKTKPPKRNDSTARLEKTKTSYKMSNSSRMSILEEEIDGEQNCDDNGTPVEVSPKKNKTSGSPRRCKEQPMESTDESENEEYIRMKRSRKKFKNRKYKSEKRRKSSEKEDEEESEEGDDTFETKRLQIIEKLENILKLTEYQMGFGMNWSTKKIRLLSSGNPLRSRKRLKKECQKVKWFISSLSSYLVGFGNAVAMLEKEISDEEVETVEEAPPPSKNSYDPILKFLGFVKNQIDVFSHKGIDLEDLLGLDVYEDEIVLGLKKKKEDESDGGEHVKPKPQPHCIDADAEKIAEEVTSKTQSDHSSGLESDKDRGEIFSSLRDEELENIITILKSD